MKSVLLTAYSKLPDVRSFFLGGGWGCWIIVRSGLEAEQPRLVKLHLRRGCIPLQGKACNRQRLCFDSYYCDRSC